MVSGTLYAYDGSQRAFKVLIAAAYSGADVKTAENFEFGKTNTTDAFLKKFPLGKVPAFEDSNGNCLSETNAIARYVSNEQLKGGSSAIDQALVQQYIDFSDNEITPSACAWTFPTLGFKQYNKQDTDKAITHVNKCFALLNDLLLSRTFLVGERVTLADITLCCDLITLYVQVLDPKFRESYGNVNRWFVTCVNQPNFKKFLGDVKLCDKMATFDNAKYQEFHPKQNKKAAKPDQKPKEKAAPKKEVAAVPATATEPPKKIDYFADVPKSTFVLDEWKKMYSNNPSEVYTKWLWENFDSKAYSLWYCKYKYNDEIEVDFLGENLIHGYLQRIEGLRKHLMGTLLMHVTAAGTFEISGLWLIRGTRNIFPVNSDWNNDAPHYEFRQLDPTNEGDRKLVNAYNDNEGDEFKGKDLCANQCFK